MTVEFSNVFGDCKLNLLSIYRSVRYQNTVLDLIGKTLRLILKLVSAETLKI